MKKLTGIIVLLLLAVVGLADEVVFKEQVNLCAPISVAVSPDLISAKDVEAGEITLYVTAHNKTAGWTVHCDAESLYISDGENKSPFDAERKAGSHLGAIGSGVPRKLTFKLPAKAKDNGIMLEIPRGVYSMIAKPEAPIPLRSGRGCGRSSAPTWTK